MAAVTTGCSFVAPALPSQVLGNPPTFSYAPLPHIGDYFGVQVTYMSGTRTCYGGAPTFTPYITNSGASFSRNCYWNHILFPPYTALLCSAQPTEIPNGPLTINYRGAASGTNSPIPFTANFGPSPTALTVTQTAVVTANTVAYTTVPPQPASTVTNTVSGAPITQKSTIQVIQHTTTTSTVTFSSCSSSSSSRSPSSSSASPSPISSSFSSSSISASLGSLSSLSSSSSSPSPTSSSSSSSSSGASPNPLSSSSTPSSRPSTSSSSSSSSPSPSSIQSSTPSSSSTPSPAPSSTSRPSPTPLSTLSPSASASPSSSASPSPSSSAGPSPSSSASPSPTPSSSSNSNAAPTTAVPSSASSATTSPSASPSVVIVPSCPETDGKTFSTTHGNFVIECYFDRYDSDLTIASPQPLDYGMCINACATTAGCQAVSYIPNGPCYLKYAVGERFSNTGVWGASLQSASSSSASLAPVSTPSSTLPPSSLQPSTSTSTSSSAVSTVSCPGSDGQFIQTSGGLFEVECSTDHGSYDMANSPVYPGSYEGCLAACASHPGCVAVSFNPGGPCYLKNGIGSPNINGNIIGGRLITGAQSSISSLSVPGTSTVAAASTSVVSSTTIVPTTLSVVSPVPVQTITVTTTVSGTGYQCTCEPTDAPINTPVPAPVPGNSAALTCPNADGTTYISDCGAKYAIECSADRYGNDLGVPMPYTNTLNDCLRACDNTPGCVDVSYSPGTPGPCYLKGSIGSVRVNSNIWGGRQLTGCSSSTKLKLHRKRVVHVQPAKRPLNKRVGLPVGPDFTFLGGRTTTVTYISTAVGTTSTATITPARSGTTTTTVYTTASTTAVVTQTIVVVNALQTTVTTCPSPTVI